MMETVEDKVNIPVQAIASGKVEGYYAGF